MVARLSHGIGSDLTCEEDAEKYLGLTPEDTDVTTCNLELEGYQCVLKEMQEKFNFKYVATTLRESYSASDNGWSAIEVSFILHVNMTNS